MSGELGSVNPHMPNIQRGSLTGVHLAIIMVATAMIAADRYYCQPLLAEMSRTLHLTPSVSGLVPTLTQAGIAFGLLLLVPLGVIFIADCFARLIWRVDPNAQDGKPEASV